MKAFIYMLLIGLSLGNQATAQNSIAYAPEDDSFFFIDEALLDSGEVLPIFDVQFQLGSSQLIDSADFRILALADYMVKHPTFIFELRCHTDCRGSASASSNLSQRRAQAVCNRLIELGVAPNQLIAKGFRDSVPMLDNGIELTCEYIRTQSATEQQFLHAKNRRLEVVVVNKSLNIME